MQLLHHHNERKHRASYPQVLCISNLEAVQQCPQRYQLHVRKQQALPHIVPPVEVVGLAALSFNAGRLSCSARCESMREPGSSQERSFMVCGTHTKGLRYHPLLFSDYVMSNAMRPKRQVNLWPHQTLSYGTRWYSDVKMDSLRGIPEGAASRRQILHGAWFLLPSPASAVFENAHLAPKCACFCYFETWLLACSPRNLGQVWSYCFLQCRVGCHSDSAVQATSKKPIKLFFSTWSPFR